MPERVDTVVIGAGQAGLATSYHLTRLGREHVVLERGEIANTWRTERWDGFYLNTPRWTQALPGHEYGGPESDTFSSLEETIAYLDEYATAIAAPVRTGAEVRRLRVAGGSLHMELGGDALEAANVVVATGAYQCPTPTPLTKSVPGDVFQLHTSDYRRPGQLPDGGVLVVGSGQSGCQIADELLHAGRDVYLAVGRCPWIPRRYRGREIVHWLVETGITDQTVDTLPTPAARLTCNPPVSGNDGGHDLPSPLARGSGRDPTRQGAGFRPPRRLDRSRPGRITGLRGRVLRGAPRPHRRSRRGDRDGRARRRG